MPLLTLATIPPSLLTPKKITMLYFARDTYCISMIEIMDQLFAIWAFITDILPLKFFLMTKSQCVDRKCDKTWKIWCNHVNRSHLGHNHDFLKHAYKTCKLT
jgi:hypothetical protein